MIENPNQQMEIQIENEAAFIPDQVIRAGNVFGTEEVTLRKDTVRNFKPSSHYAVIHYVYNGKEVQNFYRYGVWASGTNDIPRFQVSGLLSG